MTDTSLIFNDNLDIHFALFALANV